MKLPRNAYTRHVARAAGALLCKADHCGYTRMRTKAARATKLDRPAPARDLYTGPLFRAARAHVEARGLPWLVLSAGYGLIWPYQVTPPYDRTVAQLRAMPDLWLTTTRISGGGLGQSLACGALGRSLGWPSAVTLEIHAGLAYVEWLAEIVEHARHPAGKIALTIEAPLAGLEIGERLRWYAQRRPSGALFPALGVA